MKNILSISIFLLCTTFFTTLPAQGKKKKVTQSEFTVNGNCGMCKDRIENSVSVKGVKAASWDLDTQTLKVLYRPDKVDLAALQGLVAEAGHDTEGGKATEKAYDKLHACCKYRENPNCESEE